MNEQGNLNNPLVSIVVVAYNSAKYVIETLESAKDQTYQNIELIVSDDASNDETVEICSKWIEENKERFVRSLVISVPENTGIPANCNRGIYAAAGEWVKAIAGDDCLFNDAIDKGINYINNNKDVRIFAGSFSYYLKEFSSDHFLRSRDDSESIFYKSDSDRQHYLLLRNNYVHSATVFYQRQLIIDAGGFIEKYKFCEDHPLYLKITKMGIKIFYLPELVIKYRLHEDGIFSHTKSDLIFNNYYKVKRRFEVEMIYPELRLIERLAMNYGYHVKVIFDKFGFNRNRQPYSFLFSIINYFSPITLLKIVKYIKKIL